MPKYTLIKMSAPGWSKDYSSRGPLKEELFKHICNQCRTEEGIKESSSIDEMLGTACGCEFDVEEQ